MITAVAQIESRMYLIRGQQVMLSQHLKVTICDLKLEITNCDLKRKTSRARRWELWSVPDYSMTPSENKKKRSIGLASWEKKQFDAAPV